MRRDGLLTGYIWNKDRSEKVKVKAKPTNASKLSGRCARGKCWLCHDLPVSKAKSKTKGRNKRAWSRVLVDDEWAFRAKADSSRLCHVDYGGRAFTYGALDACRSDMGLFGHDDFDDVAYAAHDACCPYDASDAYAADANPPRHGVKGGVLDVHGADKIDVAGDVSNPGTHARDDVKDVGMLMHAAAAAPLNGDKMNSRRSEPKLYTPIPFMHAENLKKIAPDMNYIRICATATDTVVVDEANDDDDASSGCLSATAHAENDVTEDYEDVANDSNANAGSHAIIVHAADDVSNADDADTDADADDLYSDGDVDDLLSLISALTGGKWPACDSDELLEVESEVNSLSDEWCYVADSPDIIEDDWYLC